MHKSIVTVGLLFLLSFTLQATFACSCTPKSKIKVAYEGSQVVVSGEVIQVELEWTPDSTQIKELMALGWSADALEKKQIGFHYKKVQLKVQTLYKGKTSSDTLTIYTGRGGGDCGFRFEAGKKYIVYADAKSYLLPYRKDVKVPEGDNIYWTNICTRTQTYNKQEVSGIEQVK